MRAALVIVLAVLAAVGTSFVMNLSASETAAAQPVLDSGNATPAEVAALKGEVAALREEIAGLQAALLARSSSDGRREVLDVEAAVLAVLEERGLTDAAALAARKAEAAGEGEVQELTVESLLAMLDVDGLSDVEWGSIWNKAKEAGLMDELIAHFEQRAEENPNDADAQAKVGFAYLAKIQHVPDGPGKGEVAMKADQAFDRALEVDPNHWDARFTKALSYSFWPAFTGKPAQAVTQLEILVERQANLPRDPKHAQSYLMLGNLYQQQGRLEEAQQAWANGAALFPGNAELAAQVQAAQND